MVMGFMAGCGLPGFANFAGEATVLFGSWKSLPWIVVAASWSGLILGAVYMLRALRSILYGEERKELTAVIDLGWWRRLPFALLIAALLLFGLAPSLLSRRIEPVAKEIVKAATNRSTPSRVAAVVVTP